jgi:hypothetical protein
MVATKLGANDGPGRYRIELAPGYRFVLTATHEESNTGRRPVQVSGAKNCAIGDLDPPINPDVNPMPGPEADPTCSIPSSTQPRYIDVEATAQNNLPCPQGKSLSGSDRDITMGFEDFPEASLSNADCADPKVRITAQIN